MQMNIASGQAPGIVSKGKSLGENHREIQFLVIESDNRIHIEDSGKLTGWDYLSFLDVLRELERVGVVPSGVMAHTKCTLTEEA